LRWKRTATQIVALACTGAPARRIQLYRAPSLLSTLDVTIANPTNLSYVVSISGALGKGYRELAKAPCNQLVALGAAEYTVFVESSAPTGKWAFVALKQRPAVKGWVYVAGAFNAAGAPRIEWSVAPPVPADTLLARSRGLPDLAFGTHTQAFHVGESCEGRGDVNVWDLVVRNEGQGTAPSVARLLVSPGVPLYVNGRRVSTTRVVTLSFARPWRPGESVVVRGIPFQARVELDPDRAIRESNEGNNTLSLSEPGFYLTCG
jgi:hypothetical protein